MPNIDPLAGIKSSDYTTELVRVESSNIYAVGYDKPNKVMTVIFHDGNGNPTNAYQYYKVQQNDYTSVKNGRLARLSDGAKPSVGGTFNKLIKRNNYIYKQVNLKIALSNKGKMQ